ncbi:MAG: 2-oxoglutarate dehydrogenase complex dihydrolipoyllysine-residue succinyltransferase [Deltaproteobacteria bacterium]|nr:MAG: 2-oxoglutarate dehydrogenase complex dihydrolipoyllysine-residue succinyltransferase [Deltaproteobacteria bacterium]
MFELKVPQIGESITSAFIGTWHKRPGEAVTKGETIVEIDSDKASLEVPAPVDGVVRELRAEEGDEVDIGAVIALIEEGAVAEAEPGAATEQSSGPAADAGSPAAASGTTARAATPSPKGPQAGPAARLAAAEHGVDLRQVQGSGVRGRVLSRDVTSAAEAGGGPASTPSPQAAAPPPVAELEERVLMTPLRRTIARRLVAAQQTAAMLTTFNEVDLSEVIALRKRYQERFVERHGHKLGFMSFFVKAAVEALKAFPAVNASIDDSDPERPAIVYKRYYNIGVAVSTDRGLMVPVVRHADRLSFAEIEQAISELAARGREGRLRPDDFAGGTFTISNGGVFGSLLSTPILNPPQVGILGMHSIQERPVGIDGQVVLRPMMYLALSYDHRIIDGREAVRFLVRIKELVEAPTRLLLEV